MDIDRWPNPLPIHHIFSLSLNQQKDQDDDEEEEEIWFRLNIK